MLPKPIGFEVYYLKMVMIENHENFEGNFFLNNLQIGSS